jgi:phthalate 4,5-dioxygenase oxygenase subunit
VTSVIVPKDDHSTYFHFIASSDEGGIDQEAWRKFCVAQVGIDLDREFRPVLRNAGNRYMQDRTLMQTGNFTGIAGIPNQDIAMWESMGQIADRSSERLGASDIAIVQFRRLMIEAASRFAADGTVIGMVEPRLPQAALRSYQGIVPKTEDWRLLGASEEEVTYLQGLEEDETEKEMAGAA